MQRKEHSCGGVASRAGKNRVNEETSKAKSMRRMNRRSDKGRSIFGAVSDVMMSLDPQGT
jgi:hypothetical protein